MKLRSRAIGFLFVLLMADGERLLAQPYKSMFGSQTTSWKFIWRDIWPGPEPDSIYVEKDTMVNGTVYKKLVLDYHTSRYGGGLIREELDSGKVYFRDIYHSDPYDSTDTVEKLLFRYDLQAGDTLNGDRIDSVVVKNGRRYLYTDNFNYNGVEPLTFIEGIGTNAGLLYHRHFARAHDQYLLCSYQDHTKTDFQNVRFSGNCSPSLAVRGTITLQRQISFYPNPASKEIHITNEGDKPITGVTVIGLNGRVVKEVKQLNPRVITLSGIAGGLYMVCLSGEGFQLVKPLVVL